MAFRFEHHGTWTPTRVWHHSCCLFETYDVLQASQRTLQCSQLSHHFLRRRRAWFAAGIWDWLADSFRPRIPGGLQLCCMESAEVECWGQAWEGPKFPLLHFQLSPWQLWIHHSPSLPRLGLCSVHRRGDQLATSTDRFGKYCPGRLYCCAGIATTLEGSRDQSSRHCFEREPPDIGKQVPSRGWRYGSQTWWALHGDHFYVPSLFWGEVAFFLDELALWCSVFYTNT